MREEYRVSVERQVYKFIYNCVNFVHFPSAVGKLDFSWLYEVGKIKAFTDMVLFLH
jgi:hypothetical protein